MQISDNSSTSKPKKNQSENVKDRDLLVEIQLLRKELNDIKAKEAQGSKKNRNNNRENQVQDVKVAQVINHFYIKIEFHNKLRFDVMILKDLHTKFTILLCMKGVKWAFLEKVWSLQY